MKNARQWKYALQNFDEGLKTMYVYWYKSTKSHFFNMPNETTGVSLLQKNCLTNASR